MTSRRLIEEIYYRTALWMPMWWQWQWHYVMRARVYFEMRARPCDRESRKMIAPPKIDTRVDAIVEASLARHALEQRAREAKE